jgi:hypothetical protein
VLDVYLATVLWDTQLREVLVLETAGGPLIGMAMLYGDRVILHVVDNGDVLIDPWPSMFTEHSTDAVRRRLYALVRLRCSHVAPWLRARRVRQSAM